MPGHQLVLLNPATVALSEADHLMVSLRVNPAKHFTCVIG